MTFSKTRVLLAITCVAFWTGCGGDDKGSSNPVDPATTAEVLAVVAAMGAATEDIDIAQLFSSSEGQVVEGESGQIVVTLTTWTFEDYSPDGAMVLNGELAIGVVSVPLTIKGELQISGSQDAVVDIDMTLDISEQDNPQLGGKVIYNGVKFEVVDLIAAAGEDEEE